jgi:hypothetical protein
VTRHSPFQLFVEGGLTSACRTVIELAGVIEKRSPRVGNDSLEGGTLLLLSGFVLARCCEHAETISEQDQGHDQP